MAKATQIEVATETENENIFSGADTRTEAERAEMKRKQRAAALKTLANQEIPYVQSKLLIGAQFDIVDAIRKTIDGEKNVSFILVLKKPVADFKAGDKVSASKKLNTFTETYLDYFESFDEGETIEPLTGYTFVEEGQAKAGNKPVILRKL